MEQLDAALARVVSLFLYASVQEYGLYIALDRIQHRAFRLVRQRDGKRSLPVPEEVLRSCQ